MTVEAFRKFERQRPFEPFVVHLADGRFFMVRFQEGASLSKSGRTLYILNPDKVIEVVDMLLVISIRPYVAPESISSAG
jgi:hypothetical protein